MMQKWSHWWKKVNTGPLMVKWPFYAESAGRKGSDLTSDNTLRQNISIECQLRASCAERLSRQKMRQRDTNAPFRSEIRIVKNLEKKTVIYKIPSEMEVAPRYKRLLTLLTLFTLLKLFYTAKTLACKPRNGLRSCWAKSWMGWMDGVDWSEYSHCYDY